MYIVVRYVFQIEPQKMIQTVLVTTERITFEASQSLAEKMATTHAEDLMVAAPVQFRPGAFTFQSSPTSLVMYKVEPCEVLAL